MSENAKNLVVKMLTKSPTHRISIESVLEHPWMLEDKPAGRVIAQDRYIFQRVN